MRTKSGVAAALVGAAVAAAPLIGPAEETPKNGGTLTYPCTVPSGVDRGGCPSTNQWN